jgi:glycosyltransferase involved in cell wall biosynthesis
VRILFLTDNFPPEINAPASRTFEHCREWVRAGHEVTVITCAPNFPMGKLFEGYKNRWRSRETVEGVNVVRVWSYITANEGFLKRTLDYLSFMISATVAALFLPRPDVVVATSPQFFTACAGYAVSRMKGAPYVFELRDLWPESIRAVGAMRDGPTLRALERLELFLYRKAAAVVSVTHTFKKNLVERGVDVGKIHVVTNGADLTRFKPRARDEELARSLGLGGKFIAGYVGTHGMAHALETVIEAAEGLRDQPDLHFILLGDGASKRALKARAGAAELTNVTFVDSVPKAEVARYWSLLDVSVIHLKRTPLFATVIPSKLFECMAMGVPVLHGVEGESADIVARENVGLLFEPENVAALIKAVRRLASSPDERQAISNRAQAAATRYDRRALASEMLKVLDTVARDSNGVPDPLAN